MKRVSWTGWFIAGLLLLQNSVNVLAAPTDTNPLEGHLLQHSTGTWFLYHNGVKFAVQAAEVGDTVIDAIPAASPEQWDSFFGGSFTVTPAIAPRQGPAGQQYPAAPGQPEPFPGYS
jgi:hypothetical protein